MATSTPPSPLRATRRSARRHLLALPLSQATHRSIARGRTVVSCCESNDVVLEAISTTIRITLALLEHLGLCQQ